MDCKIEIKRKVADRSKGGVSAVWIDRDVIADLKDLSAASGWSLKDLAELLTIWIRCMGGVVWRNGKCVPC